MVWMDTEAKLYTKPIRSEEGDGTYYESRTYGSGYERVNTSLLEASTRGLEGGPFPEGLPSYSSFYRGISFCIVTTRVTSPLERPKGLSQENCYYLNF